MLAGELCVVIRGQMVELIFRKRMTYVSVRVVPRSSVQSIVMQDDGVLRVKLTASPVDGAANKQLRQLLATYYAVPISMVSIVRGHKSRMKCVAIDKKNTA